MDTTRFTARPSVCAAVVTVMTSAGVLAAPPAAAGDQAGAVLSGINGERTANGCAPLAPDAQLTAAAGRQAGDIQSTGVVGHAGSDGSTPATRIADAGYAPVSAWAENAYRGSGGMATAAAAAVSWMSSPGHRANILNCALTDVGVAAPAVGDTMTAVTVFATH